MSRVYPSPEPGDIPFNEPVEVSLDQNQEATIRFEPEQRDEPFLLPILAVSKHPDSTYRVRADGEVVYGPAAVPPTDVDDLGVTFIPARSFGESLEVRVTNLATSTRSYTVQPVGFEKATHGGGWA